MFKGYTKLYTKFQNVAAQTEKFDKNRNSTELVSKKVGNVERLKEVYLCLLKRLRVNIYTGDVQGIHEAVYQVSERWHKLKNLIKIEIVQS